MTPGTHNFNVVRGTSGPNAGLTFTLQAGTPPVPVPYDDIRLSVYTKNMSEIILRASIANGDIVVIDALTGKYEWQPTTVDTRLIPKKVEGAYYELEVWRDGFELVYLLGYITGIGGVNDDIDGFNSEVT